MWLKSEHWKYYVKKCHFYLLFIRVHKDTFKTFSMEVSNVKIPLNAKSRRYFHFKLQQGDEETRVIPLCLGNLEEN